MHPYSHSTPARICTGILGIQLIKSFDRRRNSYAKHNPPPLTRKKKLQTRLRKASLPPASSGSFSQQTLAGIWCFLTKLRSAPLRLPRNKTKSKFSTLYSNGFRSCSWKRKVWIIPHLWQVSNSERSLLLAVQTNPLICELLPCRAWGSESLNFQLPSNTRTHGKQGLDPTSI